MFLLSPVRVSDVRQELSHAVVRDDLKDSQLRLLAGVQERINIAQELLLVGLEVRVGSIEVADCAFELIFRGAVLNRSAELIESAGSALADFESILYELLEEGQDLGECFRADLGLLLKLTDIKPQYCILQHASGPLLTLLLRKRDRRGDFQRDKGCDKLLHYCCRDPFCEVSNI